MAKSRNGFGSIRKKTIKGHTYWEARYTDPVTHKQRSVSATTETECRKKLQGIQAQIFTGQYVRPVKQTVSAYLDEWLQKRVNIEPSTHELYERIIRCHIKPYIGNIRLQELRYTHCQELVQQLSHTPKCNKQLSPKTVRNAIGVLSKALDTAVRAELIVSNPASKLELPTVEKKQPKVMDNSQQAAFLSAIRHHPHRRIFLFGLYTGARISEILGLQWKNINMKTGEITIDKQLNRQKGETLSRELKSTKTHKARVNVVPPYVLDILREQSICQKEWQLKAGPEWQNTEGLVFTRQDGSYMPHNTIANSFKCCVTKIGMPDLTFHTLRHTFITDELHNGTDVKTVASLAGHSTVTTTLDVYAASTSEMKTEAARHRQDNYEKARA